MTPNRRKKPALSATLTNKPLSELVITARGERLPLVPLFDCLFVEDPDGGTDDPGMIGDIHLPPGTINTIGYALLAVHSTGPDVKGISVGDKVLVSRPQVDKIAFEGNNYFRTRSTAVIGVVKIPSPQL